MRHQGTMHYISLCSKIRCSLTYLLTQKSDVICECSIGQNSVHLNDKKRFDEFYHINAKYNSRFTQPLLTLSKFMHKMTNFVLGTSCLKESSPKLTLKFIQKWSTKHIQGCPLRNTFSILKCTNWDHFWGDKRWMLKIRISLVRLAV